MMAAKHECGYNKHQRMQEREYAMYFQYGQEEIDYLSRKDAKLGAVIAQVGRVEREVDAAHILAAGIEQLQPLGISYRKAEYITDFARKVQDGEFDLEGIWQKPDEDVIRELSALKGIGVWTAEMILLFCMQRPDVFSYDDLAIQRGLRMVYHHRKIDRKLFEKYRRRFSPYCSVASLYLWAAAGGAVPGLKDYAPKKKVPAPRTPQKKASPKVVKKTAEE